MSELQDLFEQSNPIPKGITRCGDHYAQTEYMLIDPYASRGLGTNKPSSTTSKPSSTT